jgi:hypothetical protein
VTRITERLILRLPAPAQGNCCSPRKPIRAALRIDDLKVSLNAQGTVVQHRYLGWHSNRS